MTPKDDWLASMSTKKLKGYRIKNGKVEKIAGYGLNTSAKIKQRKSKRVKVKRKLP